MSDSYGDEFQARSKYERGRLPGGRLDWGRRPEPFKSYPGSPRLPLPDPLIAETLGRPLGQDLKARRSIRSYSPKPITLVELSALLWAAQGVTRREQGFAFRTAPSVPPSRAPARP